MAQNVQDDAVSVEPLASEPPSDDNELNMRWKLENLTHNNYCVLCQDMMILNKDVVLRLGCGHIFHYKCFMHVRRALCPLCRAHVDIPVSMQPLFIHTGQITPPSPPSVEVPPPPRTSMATTFIASSRNRNRNRNRNRDRRNSQVMGISDLEIWEQGFQHPVQEFEFFHQ